MINRISNGRKGMKYENLIASDHLKKKKSIDRSRPEKRRNPKRIHKRNSDVPLFLSGYSSKRSQRDFANNQQFRDYN